MTALPAIGLTAGALPSDIASWGLKPSALQALQDALERKEISVQTITSLVPSNIAKNPQRFPIFISSIGNFLKGQGVKLVSDGGARAHRERFPSVPRPATVFKVKAPKPALEPMREEAGERDRENPATEFSYTETNAPSSVRPTTVLLTLAEEQELGRRILEHKDLGARNQLIERNLKLVHWVARKYRWSKLEYDDLIGYGNIGLMTAAERFDYRVGRFTTYATWWIRQALTRAITDQADLIRLPVHLHDFRARILKIGRERAKELGRVPTLDEIATEAEVPREKIQRALLQMRISIVSTDKQLKSGLSGDNETTLGDLIPDTTTANPEVLLEARQELKAARQNVDDVLRSIADIAGIGSGPKRDVEIFKALYGFDGSERRKTLDAVGNQFGLTRERVRQIVAALWQKISDRGSDMDHDLLIEELVRIDELRKIAESITA